MNLEELLELGLDAGTAQRVAGRAQEEARLLEERVRGECDRQLAGARLAAAVDGALLRAGAREPKTVLPLLDLEQVRLEDGELSGLDEQLEAVQRRAGFLFAGETGGAPLLESGPIASGMAHGQAPGTGGGGSIGDALREYYR